MLAQPVTPFIEPEDADDPLADVADRNAELTSPKILAARRAVEAHLKEPPLCWEAVGEPLHQRAFLPLGTDDGRIGELHIVVGAGVVHWARFATLKGQRVPHTATWEGHLPFTIP